MKKGQQTMAYIITNGNYYICYSSNGGIRKTPNPNKAIVYESIKRAIDDMHRAPSSTKSYYVYDTETEQILWRWMTEEEKERIREEESQRGKGKTVKAEKFLTVKAKNDI